MNSMKSQIVPHAPKSTGDAHQPQHEGRLRLIDEPDELRRVVREAQRGGRTVGLVPTMGALHEGHMSLVDRSLAECDVTVVTIFLNPTQFGPGEDVDQYPRNLDGDLQELRHRDCDIVFVPAVEQMYLSDHATYVDVGAIAQPLEGEHRPTHFRGVATVVLKLLQMAPADRAYFGQKDYQQTLVIKQMVRDLNLPVEIRVCPTVREPNGLAWSSRNRYLGEEERECAGSLYASLKLVESLVADGERDVRRLRTAIEHKLASAGVEQVQYIAFVQQGTVTPVERITGPTVVAIAAKVGEARLIDNHVIG